MDRERALRNFERHFTKLGDNDCWNWQGAHDPKTGAGKCRYRGKITYAAIVSFRLYKGATGELNVLHKCDNPKCVNPKHLFLGTQADNMQDAITKGRIVGRPKSCFAITRKEL